jgi:hypothetical protein
MVGKASRLAISTVALASVAGTAIANPLSDLLEKGGGSICYTRLYDSAHLDKHPGQKTTEVRMSLLDEDDNNGAIIRIMLKLAAKPNYIAGGCSWTAKANLDISNKPIIEAFKGPSGLNCWALTTEDGSSAEEGGDFFIDLKDGKSIYLYLPEYIASWPSFDRSDYAEFLQLGSEDVVFRLDQSAAKPCSEMVDRLPWLL